MKIEKVIIHNWRSIKDVEIQFEDLMMFIGQNNHGKSNVLSALLFFFGKIVCEQLDFNNNCIELYVEITFSNLDEQDKHTFKSYLTSDAKIKIRKTAVIESLRVSEETHGFKEIPFLPWLQESRYNDFSTREEIDKIPLKDYVPSSGRITRANFESAINQYIEDHRDEIEFNYILEDSHFMGDRNISKSIFGDVFYIPSVREASDELSPRGKSIFSELYSKVIQEMSMSSDEYLTAKEKINNLVSILNKQNVDGEINRNRPAQLTELEGGLKNELSQWNTTIEVEITPPDIENILRVGANVWVDDGYKSDVNRKGQGLQRALIFALINSWAKIIKKENENTTGEILSRKASNSSYFFFEEPELFLHPQAQRSLFNSLKKLSESNNQVLLCTHSSFFINLEMYKSICIVKKVNNEVGSKILQCVDDLFNQVEDKEHFNLSYWINPDRGELFFAKKVILVEGQTDKTIISYIAQKNNLFKFDYSVVECGSKDTMPQYVKLLNSFSIPYVVVYDKDHQSYKGQDAKASADISSQKIEDCLLDEIGKSIVLINDIEDEIGIIEHNNKNKAYKALLHISDEGFNLSEQLNTKIRDIYL